MYSCTEQPGFSNTADYVSLSTARVPQVVREKEKEWVHVVSFVHPFHFTSYRMEFLELEKISQNRCIIT